MKRIEPYCQLCGRPKGFYRSGPATCVQQTWGDCLPWIAAVVRALPVDAEDERIVDELMAKAQAGRAERHLPPIATPKA